MANGLMGLSNLLGQSSNAQSGGLIGGGIFSQPEGRGQRRSRLLTEAISGAGSDPYARLGAAFGGLIGMGGRAAAEGLGIVDEPEEVRRSRAIREVQQLTSERGLDPLDPGFGEFVAEQFQQRGFGDLATRSLLQARQLQAEFAPEQEPTRITVTGGTPQADAISESVGYTVPPGKTFALELTGNRVTGEKDLTGDPDEPSSIEKQIQSYINRGFSLSDAQDIAYGNVDVVTDPLDGSTSLVNTVTGRTRPVDVQPSSPQSSDEAPESKDVESPSLTEEEQGLLDNRLEVGLVPWLQEGASRTFGQFFDEANNPSVTEARTKIRQARQQLISALAVSGKPPVIEQQRIERNLPSLGPLESPERARVQLETLLDDLSRQRQADLRSINNEELNPNLRSDIQERVNAVERMIRLVDPSRLTEGQDTLGPSRSSQATVSVREAQSALPENSTLGNWDPEENGWEVRRDNEVIGYIK